MPKSKKKMSPSKLDVCTYLVFNGGVSEDFIPDSDLPIFIKPMNDEHFGVGLYSCPDFRLLKANPIYADYLQNICNRPEDPIGFCINELVSDYTGSKYESLLISIFKTGKTACLKDHKTISQNGEIKFWNKTLNPIIEEGKVKYIVSMLEDKTEDVLARKRIEAQNEELLKVLNMKDEMLTLISHELKTPLSIITSSVQTVELICSGELSDKVKKYLNKIKENANSQLKLVNNLIGNNRSNAEMFKINRVRADLVQITRNTIDSIMIFADRKGVLVSFTPDADNCFADIDPDMYERILLNLLSNAVKYTPGEKSIEVSLFITDADGKRNICVQVKDNGIGIPHAQKDMIFERFNRGDRVISRHSEGTGLGLYLVKMMVLLLNGKIEVESKEGFGSTFTLIFPFDEENTLDPIMTENISERLMTASVIEF